MKNFRKFVSVLALIVLVGSDFLTSFSYAIEEIVENTEVIQNEMGEVGENKDEENLDQSDEILDEELINHNEEIYEGEEPDEEKFEETENMENPEEISQENEEILQELSGENIDDEVIDDKMEDTEEEGKSEIEIARETLNENVIEKLEKYNEVVVNVSAKEGTFPKGTYVNIEAVKGNLTQYTLTLDPGEGSIVSGENITINEETGTGTILSEDGNVTLPLAVRENHEFLGWYTAGESFAGSGGNSYEITGNITLYAKWQEDEGVMYTVTFDANRGTFANLPTPQTVVNGSLISAPTQQQTPELPGYNFDGWWTEPRGGTQWDFANDVVTGNITLYAHWTYDLENGDLDVYILDANGDISTYVMMDRNVGASEIYNQDFSQQNTGSFGFIYQWGNNWGFERCRGNGTTCHGTGTSNPDTSTSQVDKSIWSNYYNSKYASKTWIAVNKDTPWQKNPDVKDNLWGGESDEVSDKQGPCPDGYYVPLKAEFNDIILKWNTLKGYNITANNGFSDVEIEDFTHDFLWPLAGAHRKGEITDSEQGGCAEYWTSVTSDTKNAKNIFFCKVGANTWFDGAGKRKYDSTGGATRNNGSTVRCFKNTNTSNLVIDPDGGKGAVISVDKVNGVNTIVALTEPSRTQAGVGALIFSGWYTSPTFESNTKKEARDPVNPQADPTVYTLSANETGLYAKWSCPSGHTYDGVDCASAYNITFDANEGFFDVGGESKDTKTELLDYGAIYNYSDLPTPTRSGHVFKGWYTNFDGVDDYVDYGIGFKFSDKISIHVSAYMEDWTEFADGNSGKRIISCLNGPNTAEGWAIKGKEKTKIQFACVDSSNWKSATSDKLWSSLAPGWHDFDVVFDGQNARLYLDGDSTALATSEDFTGGKLTYNSTNSILLGAQPGTSNAPYSNDPAYFHGKIKDVIIQNSDQRITSTDVLLVPHQDVTYYALWEEIDGYTVTFDSMGGSDVPSQTVKSGTTGVRPSDPTKTGYIFSGWFLDGATEEFYFTGTQITGNITLYAHWNTGVSEFTVNCYKKVLDVDHNVLENDSYSYLTGIVITGATADEITVADYAYKCVTDATEGYEYTGAVVYSSEDENGTKKETATILPDGSMKIDMFFQPVQNQFTLNPATHTSTAGSSQNGLYYYGAKVTLNGDSNDDCFEWDEWNGFPEGFENSKQTYFYMPNRAVSVTPSVTQNTYNIIFSGNGSTSGEMSPMNGLDCSESKPLTINNFEKSGYSFSGWSETENGAKKYENNESVSRLSTIDKDDVFLYAVWDVDQYDVNVSVETGQENMGYLSGNTSTGVSLTGLYNYATELVFIAVPELGFVFDYWMDLDAGEQISGEEIEGGKNKLEIVVEGIMNIIAFFKPSDNTPYTVEHYKQNLDQTGYEFDWSGIMYGTTDEPTNATGTDYEGFSLSGDLASYQTGIKADGSTIVRLYYDRDTYTVTWNMWEGHLNRRKIDENVSYGTTPIFEWDDEDKYTPKRGREVDTDDIKYDFIFTGWIKDGSAEIIKDLTTQIVTGNVTYTAQYDTGYRYYEIRYHPGEGTGSMVHQSLQLYSSGTLTKNTFTKTGYDFSGWWYEYGDGIEVFYEDEQEINLGVEDDVIKSDAEWEDPLYLDVYAQWKPNTDTKVTVNYYLKDLDADNNVLINSTTEYDTGVEFTGTADSIIDSILTAYGTGINGYEYSKSIVYGSDYPSGIETGTTTVLADGSRVIDMYYVPSIYQFTLNSESYSSTAGSSESTGYYYGARVTLSGNSNDDCFTWSGWTTSGITLSDNTLHQTWFAMPANDVEITPSTMENIYNIIFNGNGSNSGTMSPMNGIRCTESTGLAINTFEKSGHTFTGWSTTVGGSKEYVDGATVDRLSTGADVNLYAVWDINEYNVNAGVAVGDHGSLQWTGSGIYDFGETLVIIAVPELGYLFDYWEVNGSTELPEGATTGENQLTIVVNQILDIVAHFTENEKTVTVNYYEMNTGGVYPNDPYDTDSLTGLVGQTKSINPEFRIGFHLDDNRSNTGVTISENSEDNVINIYYERERYIIETSGRSYQMPTDTHVYFVNIIPDNQPHYQYYYGEEIEIEYLNPEGWNFSGWYDATSEGKGFPSNEVNLDSQNITFHMPNHDVWVEPIMYHIPYTLSFTGYEGAEITNLESCSYGTGDRETYYDYSECLPNLNKEGYWFNGWDDENGNWVRRLNDYSQYPILNRMPAHDYKLVANFEPRKNMSYEKYYYLQDIEGTGYTLSGDLTDLGNNDGVTDQEMPGREPLYNIDGFQYSGFGYSGVMLPRDQWPIIKPIGDNYINYYYDRKVYLVDVNYDNKIMSITGAGEYRYEAPVNLVATVNTGYQFSGFSSYQGELLSSGSVYNFTMPDSFVDIYADANPIEYSIEYEPNGGELDPYSSYVNYTVESSDLSIGNPYKDGYKFLGWTGGVVSGGIEGEEDIVEPTRDLIIAGGSIGDRKYYANWEPDEVKVTVNYYLKKIDSENNTLIDGVDIYLAGVEYTGLSDDIVNIFSRYGTGIEGYSYDHSTVFSGGERTGATETIVLPDGTREINMYYIPNKYNFTLNSDSYSSTEGSSESTGYYYGATVRLSGDSNNDCFTWSGWTTSGITLSDATLQHTSFTMPANDVEATPSTTENMYNIIFNGNGSNSGIMSPMNGVRCTESIGLTLNSFGKNGYTFTGWSTTSGDNNREYIDGQAVSGLSMNDGENVNLYAVWNIDWYTVTFDLNGGSLTGDMTLITGYTIETSSISLERYIPVKSGYTLIGWYKDDTLVDHIAGGETGDYILIAHWKADSDTLYTVKYYKENLNGGYDVWTGIYTGETDIEVTALVKDFTGFTYSGGNENNVTTGVVIGDGSLVLKLYYDRNEYEVITGEVEHGTMEGGTGSQKYGKRITFTAHPDAGYVISKWLRDGNEILSGGVIWTGEELEIKVDTGMEISVEFKAKEDTPYYVEYYKEKLGGGYDVWTGTYSGTTDQEAVAQELSFTGFTFSGGNQSNITSGVIAGDGSLVLKLFYDRNKYTITWKDGNDEVLKTDQLFYGALPEYTGEMPTKTATAQYSYTFNNTWTPAIEIVTTGVTYTAQFDVEVNKYLITFVDGDGKIVQSGMVVYGEMPQYTGTTPTKTATAQYSYTFNNTWAPAIELVTTGVTYTAQFDSTVNEYTISIVPSDTDMGTVSPSEINVSYGSTIVESGNIITVGGVEVKATPKSADVQYTYEFDSWTNTCGSELIGTCTIQANFRKILNKYSITWMNDDGSLIDTTMVGYGVIPTHAKPTKTETEEYRYVFVGWDPEVVAVVGDAEYTAVFNAEEKEQTSKGGNMSGGGGRRSGIDNAENSDNQHGSAEENSNLFTGDYYVSSGNVDEETLSLYEWAHENDITTMDTLEYANPDGLLTRGHMAKMAVNFAQNVLGKTIPTEYPDKCNWKDKESERESSEIKEYAKKACALGLMGIYVEEFMPNKVLDRAEFGTIISRLLWGDKYNVIDTDHRGYYEDHLGALKKHGILTQTDNPEERRELRKWVWLVFRRISEKLKK